MSIQRLESWSRVTVALLCLAVPLPAAAGDDDAPAPAEAPDLQPPDAPEVQPPDLSEPPAANAADASDVSDVPAVVADLLDPADDALGLRLIAERDPRLLGPLSIGTPDSGLLLNPIPFPEGAFWKLREPEDSWATDETIAFLVNAIEAVEAAGDYGIGSMPRKTVPRGYDKESPRAKYLLWEGLPAMAQVTVDEARQPDFSDRVLTHFRNTWPIGKWLLDEVAE